MKKVLNKLETRYLVIVDFKYMMKEIISGERKLVTYDEASRTYIMRNIHHKTYYHYDPDTYEKFVYFPAYGPYSSKEMFSFIVPCHWQETLYKLPGEATELYYRVSYSEFA